MSIVPSEIRAELDRILGNPLFKPKRNMCRLLEHLVTETLEGRAEDLKGYSIALDVFKQSGDYDSDRNPLVRVNAGRLRTLLRLYYLGDGKEDPIRIEVPKGTYVPSFSQNAERPSEAASPAPRREIVRNTIAVAPFRNLSGRSELDFFGTGFAQDLSDALFRFEDYRVTGLSDRGDEESEICNRVRERGIAFLVDGNVQAMGSQVRVSVQIIDTEDESTLWADRVSLDLSAEDAFEKRVIIVDRLAGHIAGDHGHINRALLSGIADKLDGMSIEQLATLKNYIYNPDLAPEALYSMQETAESFLDKNPDSALFNAFVADKHGTKYLLDAPDAEDAFEKLGEHAERAYALDPDNAQARASLGLKCFVYRERERFFHLLAGSTEGAAPSIQRLGPFATYACCFGEWELGKELLDRILANNARVPEWLFATLALYQFQRGAYDLALKEANKIHTPNFFWAPLHRFVSLVQLERVDEAKHAYQDILSCRPDFESRGFYLITRFITEEELVERFLESFRRAGVDIART